MNDKLRDRLVGTGIANPFSEPIVLENAAEELVHRVDVLMGDLVGPISR